MKNVRSLVMNIALVVVGVFTLIFMSQAYISVPATFIDGYQFLEIDLADAPIELVLTTISVIINLIVASALILSAIVKLLTDCGVIKNKKVAKVFNVLNMVLAIVLLCSNIVAISCVGSYISGSGLKIGWALILILVLAFISTIAIVVEKVLSKKK